jgi:protein-S-isoprenylcysteine O-methyltransferase Ste14
MTACILYGLALARFLYGVSNSGESRTAGSSVAAISILPLFGVIVSIICISKTTQQSVPPFIEVFQYVNLVAAILVFLFLGGYGLNRIERHGKDETEKHR